MKYIPCVKYGYELKTTEMDSVKLEKTVAGTTRKRTVPVFSAKYGVSGLFHVIDKFHRAADKLDFTVAEKWNKFEEVLDDTSEQKWTNHIVGIGNNQRTLARFEQALEEFVHSYAGSPEPRDVLKEYICSDECRKLRNVDPDKHGARIETLCRFANRLSGDEPPYDEEMTKKAVFSSFAEKWQREFLKSGKLYTNDGMEDIIGYMNLLKGMEDEDNKHRGKKRQNNEDSHSSHCIGGGGNNHSVNSGRYGRGHNRGEMQPNDQCKIPNHGNHKWKDCSLNPRISNYGMFQGGHGGQTSGHGSGRFGGRGTGGQNMAGG